MQTFLSISFKRKGKKRDRLKKKVRRNDEQKQVLPELGVKDSESKQNWSWKVRQALRLPAPSVLLPGQQNPHCAPGEGCRAMNSDCLSQSQDACPPCH